MNVVASSSPEAIAGVAPVAGAPADLLILDATGRLMTTTPSSAGLTMRGVVPFASGDPLSLDTGLTGEVFLTARSTAGVVPTFSIFRIEPSAGR
jgi:hypothetical protein